MDNVFPILKFLHWNISLHLLSFKNCLVYMFSALKHSVSWVIMLCDFSIKKQELFGYALFIIMKKCLLATMHSDMKSSTTLYWVTRGELYTLISLATPPPFLIPCVRHWLLDNKTCFQILNTEYTLTIDHIRTSSLLSPSFVFSTPLPPRSIYLFTVRPS